MLIHEELTHKVCGSAIEVHRELGPGLLESAYEIALCHELTLRRIPFRRQVPLPVVYKGVELDAGYRLDLVVDEKVVVELKTLESILPVHEAQLLTYIKLSNLRVGLLLNFFVPVMKDGILRRVR